MYLALALTARYVDYGRSARTRPTQPAESAGRDEHVETSRRLWHVPMNPTYAIGRPPLRVDGTSRTSMLAATTRVSALIASALTLTLGVLLFTPLAAARPLTPAPDADTIAGPAIGSELADGGHTAPAGIRRPPEVDALALAGIVAPPEADALAPRVDRTGAGMWQWSLGDNSFFVTRTAP